MPHIRQEENISNEIPKLPEAFASLGQKEPRDPWMHRTDFMQCHSCMWFLQKGSGRVGRCRRHAPTMNGYPVVYLNDWCGDHKVDENKQ